jgi:hypothetical protein
MEPAMTIAPPNEFPDVATEFDAAASEAHAELSANADTRKDLRREVDNKELRLAAHNLLEGVRGVVRVAPLLSVALGLAIGVAWAPRGRRRAPVRRS